MYSKIKYPPLIFFCAFLVGCASSSLSYRGLVNGMYSKKILTDDEYDRIRQFSEQGYINRSYADWAKILTERAMNNNSTISERELNKKLIEFAETNLQLNMKLNYLELLKGAFKSSNISEEIYKNERERILTHRNIVNTKYSFDFLIYRLEKGLADDSRVTGFDKQLALKAKQFMLDKKSALERNRQQWREFGQAMLVGLAATGNTSTSSYNTTAYGYNSPVLVNGNQTYNNSIQSTASTAYKHNSPILLNRNQTFQNPIQSTAFTGQSTSAGGVFGKYNPSNPFSEYSSPFGSYNPSNPFSEYSSPFGSMNKSNPFSEVSSPFGSMNPNNPFSEVSSPFGNLNPDNPFSEVSSPFGSFNPSNPFSEGIDPYHYQENYLEK